MSRKRVPPSSMSFLDPSGKTHSGRTYEDFYSVIDQNRPVERDLPLDFTPPEPGRSFGKAAPAGMKKQRHKHDWLVRHDYMQCRSCGVLLTIKKDRGSVDQ